MIGVRWSDQALTALDTIGDYIGARDPAAALSVVDAIVRSVGRLRDFPLSGALTAVPGVRKVSVPRYRYVTFYRPTDHEIIVLNVRHAAENWR